MAGSRCSDASRRAPATSAPATSAVALAEAARRMAAAATVAASLRQTCDAGQSDATAVTAAAPSMMVGNLAAVAGLAASANRAAAAAPAAAVTPSNAAPTALVAAAAAGRAAAVTSYTAIDTAVAEATASGRRRTSRPGRDETVGELEGSVYRTVDSWLERNKPQAAAAPAAYMPPVSPQVLQSPATTREMLMQLCTERTIPFGADDSAQSLKASLVRFNATGSTVWGARMQSLAVFVRNKGKDNFFASMEHASDVEADQGSVAQGAPSAATPARPPAPVRRSSPSPSPRSPPPRARAADPRPPLYPATPSSRLPCPAAAEDPSTQERTGSQPDAYTPEKTPCTPASPAASLPVGLLPSSQHAAMMMQSMAAEQDVRMRGLAKNAQVVEVRRWLRRWPRASTPTPGLPLRRPSASTGPWRGLYAAAPR